MNRAGPFLVLLLVMGAAGAIFTSVEAPSALESSEAVEPLPLEPPLPDAFEPWPPFVVSWQVSGDSPPRERDSLWALAWDPCPIIRTLTCHVRFAWESWQRWALQASSDPTFDDRDALQLTLGPVQYMVQAGIVQAVGDGARTPPFDACKALLRARHQGQTVKVEGSEHAGRPVLAFSGSGVQARCLGDSGIPIEFSDSQKVWSSMHIALRTPTDQELGLPLVEGRADGLPQPTCRLTGADIEASVVAWTTEDHPGLLPAGMRRRSLGEGLVADEMIQPAPVISVPAGRVRLWVMSGDEIPDSRVALENHVHHLGLVAQQLLGSLDQATEAECPRS